MNITMRNTGIIASGLFCTSLSLASDNIRTDAFITAGGTFSDSAIPFEGAAKDINFNQLSRIGIQYSYKPKHDIPVTFTGQLLARGYDDWAVTSEWALISYRPSSSWLINAGKIRTALFMYSQFYDVGVTYPWTTPPEEVYGVFNIPFTSMGGLEVINTQFLGDWALQTRIQTGTGDFNVPAMGLDVPVQMEHLHTLQFNLSSDDLTINLAFGDIGWQSQELSTLGGDPRIQGAFSTLAGSTDPAVIAGLASQVGIANTTNGKAEFFDLGIKYDSNVLLIAEIVKRRLTNTTFPTIEAGYLTAGYHFNKYTPLITYARSDTSNSLIQQEQASVTIGLNIATSASSLLKFELKNTQIDDGSVALFPGIDVNNVGLYDELPVLFGGNVIEDSVNKVSITFSTVL